MKWRNFIYQDSQTVIRKLSLQPSTSRRRAKRPVYYNEGKSFALCGDAVQVSGTVCGLPRGC